MKVILPFLIPLQFIIAKSLRGNGIRPQIRKCSWVVLHFQPWQNLNFNWNVITALVLNGWNSVFPLSSLLATTPGCFWNINHNYDKSWLTTNKIFPSQGFSKTLFLVRDGTSRKLRTLSNKTEDAYHIKRWRPFANIWNQNSELWICRILQKCCKELTLEW